MKKFALTVVGAAVFFTGLGAVVENAGAKGKSDERALELVRKARLAIGGDAAINGVQSLRIVGQSTKTVKFDGTERTHSGETEIALQFPDKLMRSTKIGSGEGHLIADKTAHSGEFDLIVTGDMREKIRVAVPAHRADGAPVTNHRIVIKKADGTTQELTGAEAEAFIASNPVPPAGAHTVTVRKKADGTVEEDRKVVVGGGEGGQFKVRLKEGQMPAGDHTIILDRVPGSTQSNQNEMFRLTLSLLMAAPQGVEVIYTMGGEGNVDGDLCDIVNASVAGQSYKLYLSRASGLPVMVGYKSARMPQMFFRTAGPKTEAGTKETASFTRTLAVPAAGEPAEVNVKFSNYRATNGVNLPYRWTQTVGGNADEVFDVTSYELNPANIADKFKDQKVFVRELKPATK